MGTTMFGNLIIAEIPIGFNLNLIKHLKNMVSQKKPVNQLEFTISSSCFNRTSMMLCKDTDVPTTMRKSLQRPKWSSFNILITLAHLLIQYYIKCGKICEETGHHNQLKNHSSWPTFNPSFIIIEQIFNIVSVVSCQMLEISQCTVD